MKNVEKNIETVHFKYFSGSAAGTETKKFWLRADLFIRRTETRVKYEFATGKKNLRDLVTACINCVY